MTAGRMSGRGLPLLGFAEERPLSWIGEEDGICGDPLGSEELRSELADEHQRAKDNNLIRIDFVSKALNGLLCVCKCP